MSQLERDLLLDIRAAGLPIPTPEFKAIPERRYRWDFAYPDKRLLIEVQGAIFKKGAHSSGVGITRDITKSNIAMLNGWRVLAFTAAMIRDGMAVKMIATALNAGEYLSEINLYGTKEKGGRVVSRRNNSRDSIHPVGRAARSG